MPILIKKYMYKKQMAQESYMKDEKIKLQTDF